MTEDEKILLQGKQLFTVQITYEYKKEIKLHKMYNQTSQDVQKIREALFLSGLAILMNAGHWTIIPPGYLIEIEIFLQRKIME